jgi:membrane-bound lytic murein transglycosylase MltF
MNNWFFKVVNIGIFISGLFFIVLIESERSESSVFMEMEVINKDIAIPQMTLTSEDEIKMFFDKIHMAQTDISRRDVIESISTWETYIKIYSRQYGIDSDLVRAIIYAESKGDPFTISRNGALGLMQLMPETADFIGISNPLDPEENIKAGTKYISWLIKNGIKNEDTYLLWAWNAGLNAIGKGHMPGETKRFITEVLSIKLSLKDNKDDPI